MRLVIFGPPGVGKGTQAERIERRHGCCHISTGDALRDAMLDGSGSDLHAYMDQGSLVPDELVAGIIERRMRQPDCEDGYILDGYPRTVRQALMLEELVRRQDRPLRAALFLDAPAEVLIERISGRRVCPRCHLSYHVTHAPPKRDGFCDDDGEKLTQRPDDAPAAVHKRLKIYAEETAPLIQHFRQRGLLEEINASSDPATIEREIQSRLDKRTP